MHWSFTHILTRGDQFYILEGGEKLKSQKSQFILICVMYLFLHCVILFFIAMMLTFDTSVGCGVLYY